MKKQRIVIKVGTNVLQRPSSRLDYNVISDLGEEIAKIHHAGHEIVLVSSGAVGAGRESCSLNIKTAKAVSHVEKGAEIPSERLMRQQVLAAVGQVRLMQIYSEFFHKQQITTAQLLLTHADFQHKYSYLNIRGTLEELLHFGVLPIVNENDVISTEELEANFGDNDQLAVYVAALLEADQLFFLTVVPGLLTSSPGEEAQIIDTVKNFDSSLLEHCFSERSSGGTGGMKSKVTAAAKAMSLGMDVHIMDGKKPSGIMNVLEGGRSGTKFVAYGNKLQSHEEYAKIMSLDSFEVVRKGEK